jgi:hypothetical protein
MLLSVRSGSADVTKWLQNNIISAACEKTTKIMPIFHQTAQFCILAQIEVRAAVKIV